MPEEKNKLDQLLENQALIIDLLNRVKETTTYPDGDNRFITTTDMCADLSISKSYFSKVMRPEMPFLFRLRHNSDYRAKLSDYRKWKKSFFKI